MWKKDIIVPQLGSHLRQMQLAAQDAERMLSNPQQNS